MNPSVQINIYGGGARARQPSSLPSAQLSPGVRRPPRWSLPPRRPPSSFLPVCTALSASRTLRAAPSLARRSLPVRAALQAGLSPRASSFSRRSLLPLFRYASPSLHAALSRPSVPVSPCAPLPLSHAALSRYAPPSTLISPPAPAHSLLAALCFCSLPVRATPGLAPRSSLPVCAVLSLHTALQAALCIT